MESPTLTYAKTRREINERLAEFKKTWETGSILNELVFCLCTPQTNAHKGWNAAQEIISLNNPNREKIATVLRQNGVRFHNNKSTRIEAALENYSEKGLRQLIESSMYSARSSRATRNFIASIVNGFGMKEASHFMRNIGFFDVAILDRHIMRRLLENTVIEETPKLKKQTYLEIEEKMSQFADRVNVPLGALDLVFWYQSKGEIFK